MTFNDMQSEPYMRTADGVLKSEDVIGNKLFGISQSFGFGGETPQDQEQIDDGDNVCIKNGLLESMAIEVNKQQGKNEMGIEKFYEPTTKHESQIRALEGKVLTRNSSVEDIDEKYNAGSSGTCSVNGDVVVTTNSSSVNGTYSEGYTGYFEGPEKLLEIWFRPDGEEFVDVEERCDGQQLEEQPDAELFEVEERVEELEEEDMDEYTPVRKGLRKIPRRVLRRMLELVQCSVLDSFSNEHVDSYLLSESSMFVYPHKIILKTCGTTTLLVAVERILELAKLYCGITKAYQVFYSRKSFMFPERQPVPHTSWTSEVRYLDSYFGSGEAYVIGNVNNDHWFVYMSPIDAANVPPKNSTPAQLQKQKQQPQPDTTIEILMTGLDQDRMRAMYCASAPGAVEGTAGGAHIDATCKIDQLFPKAALNSYMFSPCGYSSNALLKDHYFTIHVTPEPVCSYASFETNIPLTPEYTDSPSLDQLVQNVVDIFCPARFSVSVFRSKMEHSDQEFDHRFINAFNFPSATNFVDPSKINGYRKAERILYEFDHYWLRYSHFIKS